MHTTNYNWRYSSTQRLFWTWQFSSATHSTWRLTRKRSCTTVIHYPYHLSLLRHGTHKAATSSLQRTRSCTAFRISLHVRFMDFSSFSADLLQVVYYYMHPYATHMCWSCSYADDKTFVYGCPLHPRGVLPVNLGRVRGPLPKSITLFEIGTDLHDNGQNQYPISNQNT